MQEYQDVLKLEVLKFPEISELMLLNFQKSIFENLEKNQKEIPGGTTSWSNSARYFQRLLINRWCRTYR